MQLHYAIAQVDILWNSGLKPSSSYQIKSTHHSTSHPGGSLTIEYGGEEGVDYQESPEGQIPNPPYVRTVTTDAAGKFALDFYYKDHRLDLNALEIEDLTPGAGEEGDNFFDAYL